MEFTFLHGRRTVFQNVMYALQSKKVEKEHLIKKLENGSQKF